MLSFILATTALLPAAEGLGDSKFARRESAHRTLSLAGALAPLSPRTWHDIETTHRLHRLRAELACAYDRWYEARAERLRPAKGWPWIWLGDYGDAARAFVTDGGWGPDYPGWREGARRWAEAKLRGGWGEAKVAAHLERMAAAEEAYKARQDR